jgi:hypothetical protein
MLFLKVVTAESGKKKARNEMTNEGRHRKAEMKRRV